MFQLAADAAMGKTRPAHGGFRLSHDQYLSHHRPAIAGLCRQDDGAGRQERNPLRSPSAIVFPGPMWPMSAPRRSSLPTATRPRRQRSQPSSVVNLRPARCHRRQSSCCWTRRLDRALFHQGKARWILADVADNAGGGAPGDSTVFLRRISSAASATVASGFYWDPIAVKFCMEAGLGATFDLRMGGKTGPTIQAIPSTSE